jgi:hypothetical protein
VAVAVEVGADEAGGVRVASVTGRIDGAGAKAPRQFPLDCCRDVLGLRAVSRSFTFRRG